MSVDMIFNNGSIIFNKEQKGIKNIVNWANRQSKTDTTLAKYTEDYIKEVHDSNINIYGDYFKIMIYKNYADDFILRTIDYDDDKESTTDITLNFTQNEFKHLIFALQQML